jgi:hypothetical protein
MFIIRAGEEGVPSRGPPRHGPVTRFFLQHLGEKGILQPCGGDVLQLCGEGELLLPGQGVAVRPPPGRWSCRAQVAAVAGAEVVAAAGEASRRSGCLR